MLTAGPTLAFGLLLHESVYFSSRGTHHFRDDVAPFLGMHMAPRARAAAHTVFCISSIAFALFPNRLFVWCTLTLTLAIVIGTFPRRLPNHLVVSLFFLLLVGTNWHSWIANGPAWRGGAQLLAASTLVFAGFHKINRGFLTANTSCGAGLVLHYLLQRRLPITRMPSFLYFSSTFGVIFLELALPCGLFMSESAARLSLIAISILMVAFGFLGHFHFATIMFALLSAFVGVSVSAQTLGLAALLSLPLALALGNPTGYAYRWLARLNGIVFCVIALGFMASIIHGPNPSICVNDAFRESPVGTVVLLILYALNAAAPYFGLKWTGSLIMFSNLRPDIWDHLVIRQRARGLTPRYVSIRRLVRTSSSRETSPSSVGWFSRPESDRYAIGYVCEAASCLRATIDVVDSESGEALALSGDPNEVRWYERLSLFPVSLPPQSEPLCA